MSTLSGIKKRNSTLISSNYPPQTDLSPNILQRINLIKVPALRFSVDGKHFEKGFFKKADANIRNSVYSVRGQRGDELLLRPVISYFHAIRFSSIFQHSR